jgi:hypothetical protein
MTGSLPAADPAVAARVRQTILAQRGWRILRNAVFFVLVTIGMVCIVMWQRDSVGFQYWNDVGRKLADAMQTEFDRTDKPPMSILGLDPKVYQFAINRLGVNPSYDRKVLLRSPVVAAGTVVPSDFYLRGTGRELVLFDGRTFTPVWIPEAQFLREAETLGVLIRDRPPAAPGRAASQPDGKAVP